MFCHVTLFKTPKTQFFCPYVLFYPFFVSRVHEFFKINCLSKVFTVFSSQQILMYAKNVVTKGKGKGKFSSEYSKYFSPKQDKSKVIQKDNMHMKIIQTKLDRWLLGQQF